MKRLLFTIVILCMAVIAFAQTYKGNVKDTKGEAIPFANVVLYTLPDSTFVGGTTTNDFGQFLLESKKVVKGYLEISSIGYKTQTVPAKEQLGNITLKEAINELGEVVVKSQLPKMQVKEDAFVTIIQNSVLAKAGSANNVLQRLPMLTGKDGIYTVFGKGQAKIYINNREMRDASELENLNSDDIKSVDIVTNPGARYDASVKAVIRIYTIKRAGDGFSFNVRSSYYQGVNADWTEKLNMNFRKKGWDIFGTASYSNGTTVQESFLKQVNPSDTLWEQQSELYSSFKSKYLNIVAGTNYEISPKHFLGVKYSYIKGIDKEDNARLSNMMYADEKLYDKWITNGVTNYGKMPKHILNGYYSGTFGKLDINFDITFFTKKEVSSTTTRERSDYHANRTINTKSDVVNDMFASKITLNYPVLKGNLSFGGEYTNTNRDDIYWADKIVTSSATKIEQKSKSLFAEYKKDTPLGQFSAGLRHENIQSDYFVNDTFVSEQSKTYNQYFPSFSYSAKIKEISLQLSYTSRINRPSYRQLSNNTSYINRFTLQSGNPFLNPSITHDITFAGSWKILQFMLSYRHQKDAIIYSMEQMKSTPSMAIIRYKNLDKLPQFSAYLSLSPRFGIWSPQLNLGIQKQWMKLNTNEGVQHLNNIIPMASFNNSFQLSKNFIVTLDSFWRGKGDMQNNYLKKNNSSVSIGITKILFNDRLTVAIKGWDIFKGERDIHLLRNENIKLYQSNYNDTREIEITVRYKFNSAKSKYKGKGAGNSEINRM